MTDRGSRPLHFSMVLIQSALSFVARLIGSVQAAVDAAVVRTDETRILPSDADRMPLWMIAELLEDPPL